MEQTMAFFKLVHIQTRQDNRPGEKNHIDAEKLRKYFSLEDSRPENPYGL